MPNRAEYEKKSLEAAFVSEPYYRGWRDAAKFNTPDPGLEETELGRHMYYQGFTDERKARHGS